MPNPDPTHPKFLEGDEGFLPNRNDDDVEGHLATYNQPAEGEANPEGAAAATDDAEGDDTKGHLLSY